MVEDDHAGLSQAGAVLSTLDGTEEWRLQEGEGFELRIWGDEAVVFHSARAATHLIGLDAAAVLLTLREAGHGMPFAGILQVAQRQPSIPFGGDDLRLVEVLDALKRVGLVASTRPA